MTTKRTPHRRRDDPTRKRRNTQSRRVPLVPTKVRVCRIDNAWVYRVSLGGQHGSGKWMTIDQPDWLEVVRLLGDMWNLKPCGRKGGQPAAFQITTSRKEALANTDRRWPNDTIVLSRWLVAATDTQRVYHRNRNGLDVRRSNLLVLDFSPDTIAA